MEPRCSTAPTSLTPSKMPGLGGGIEGPGCAGKSRLKLRKANTKMAVLKLMSISDAITNDRAGQRPHLKLPHLKCALKMEARMLWRGKRENGRQGLSLPFSAS